MKESMPPEVWAAIERRDRTCRASAYGFGSAHPCTGRPVVHHRLPRGRGGTHDPENLVLLCNWHHVEVHDQPRRAYDARLLLRSGAVPT